MTNQLRVTFPYSPAEHVEALGELPRLQAVRKWWRLTGVALIALVAGFAAIVGTRENASLASALSLLVLLLPVPAFWFLMPALQKRLQIIRFRRSRVTQDQVSESRVFGPDGFAPSAEWTQPIPWALVTRVLETNRFFFLFHAMSGEPVYVPKHALSEHDVIELRSLLANEFRSRPGDLQLRAGAT